MNKILSHSQSAKLIEYLTIEPVSSTRAVDASVHSNKPIKIKKINPSQFSLIRLISHQVQFFIEKNYLR